MNNPPEYVDSNWCPDCGERADVCTCAPELPFAGYWDWYEDEADWLDDEECDYDDTY